MKGMNRKNVSIIFSSRDEIFAVDRLSISDKAAESEKKQ